MNVCREKSFPVFLVRPSGVYRAGNGRIKPSVQNVSLRLELFAAASGALLNFRPFNTRINRNPIRLGKYDLIAFLAVPYGDRSGKHSLSGYYPVPFQRFG